MCGSRAQRAHLVKLNRHAAPRALPCGFGTCEASAYDFEASHFSKVRLGLFEVSGSFNRLWSGTLDLFELGRSVFRLDLMAAVVAVHTAFSSLGRGHGGVHGNLAFALEIGFNLCNQFYV